MDVRIPASDEIPAIAKVWYDAWQDAHAQILPAALAADRTEASFRTRLATMLPNTRVIGELGEPLGFCTIKEDELYQLFVARAARGTDVAIKLLDDGEGRLATAGYQLAWLSCAIGNERAARFYEKRGWYRARTFTSVLDTARGKFELDAWRYEKTLA